MLLETFERENQIATNCFKQNKMIADPDKFRAIVVKRYSDMNDQYAVDIDGSESLHINLPNF